MENNELIYFSKEDCIKRGFIRLSDGTIYKCNTIERYAIKGFLNGAEYDVDELLLAAKTLYKDFYDANIENTSSNNPLKIKVDGQRNSEGSEEISYAMKRLNKALKTLPWKTQNIVIRVCCEDKDIIVAGTKEQRIRLARYALEILKLGLCKLVKHYSSIEMQRLKKQQIR